MISKSVDSSVDQFDREFQLTARESRSGTCSAGRRRYSVFGLAVMWSESAEGAAELVKSAELPCAVTAGSADGAGGGGVFSRL